MKKKKMKLSLNKEVIAKMQMKSINGGDYQIIKGTAYNEGSCILCYSWEPNCHSENANCDCDTTGNC